MNVITINGVTLYKIKDGGTTFIATKPMSFEEASRLKSEGLTYKAFGWDFWGDTVFTFDFIQDENRNEIASFLEKNGVGKKRSKRITDELIRIHKVCEDLEGVKMD